MAHDHGPAPVPMFFVRRVCTAARRLTLGLGLLGLAVPLLAQQRDPALATQAILAKCEKIFLTCAKVCLGDTCTLCEEERKKCTAEVYAITPIPTPRLPAGWVPPGGWIFPVPPLPGTGNSTPPFPWPQPPATPPPPPSPPGQPATHCDPAKFNDILQRHRDRNGVPSYDVLLTSIDNNIGQMNTWIEEQEATANDPDKGFFEKRSAKKEIEKARLKLAVLSGAAKLLDEMARAGKSSDETLVALELTVARVLDEKRGLKDRGGIADKAVGEDGSEASVIRSTMTSYHDKENALAHLLVAYGAGENLPDIDRANTLAEMMILANRTARESLIAACRAEPMGPVDTGGSGGGGAGGSGAGGGAGGGGGSNSGECQGQSYDTVTQCCSEEGVGDRVEKTRFTIDDCPPTRRAPNPAYKPARNGCGTDVTNVVTGDLPNNPNFRLENDGVFWIRIRRVPVPVPKYKRVYYGPSFLPACDFHDECWGTCNTPKTGTTQENCDIEFGQRMNQICDANLTGEDLVDCRARATAYQKAVSLNFLYAYDAAQSDACHCCEGTGT